jgi:hypothetical protein
MMSTPFPLLRFKISLSIADMIALKKGTKLSQKVFFSPPAAATACSHQHACNCLKKLSTPVLRLAIELLHSVNACALRLAAAPARLAPAMSRPEA